MIKWRTHYSYEEKIQNSPGNNFPALHDIINNTFCCPSIQQQY